MENSGVLYYPLSALINAVTSLLVCVYVLVKGYRALLNRTVAAYAAGVSLWSFCYFIWQLAKDAPSALFWCRVLMFWAIIIPAVFFHLSVTVIERNRYFKQQIKLAYLLCSIFLVLDFTSFIVLDVRPRLFFLFWPTAGKAYIPFLIYFMGYVIYSCTLMFNAYKQQTGVKRNQIKYVFIGTTIAFIGGSTNYPLWFDINIPPIGNILVTVWVILIAYAITRYRLLDIRVAVSRAGIFALVYIGVLLFSFWFYHQTLSPFWSIVSALVLATVGPFIFNHLRTRAEARLLADQLRMQETLREFARNLAHIRDTKQLVKELVETDYAITQPEFLALYGYFPALDAYIPKHTVPDQYYPLGKLVKKDSPLLTPFFTASDTDKYKPVPVELFEADAPHDTFAFPLWNLKSGGLYGFLALGPKCNKIMYAGTDLEIFEIIAAQAAVVLETCLFWEDEKTRLAREEQIRRFKAMDHFSSGMAHEINNPITGVLGRAQGARKTLARIKAAAPGICGQDVAELDKEIAVIFEEVDRVANLIQNVKDLSAQNQGEFNVIALDDVMKLFLEIIGPQVKIDEIAFSSRLEAGINLEGNKISLVEVLMNIGINAIYAVKYGEALDLHDDEDEYNRHMAKPKTIEVKTYRTDPGHCRIELRDNGSGIVKDMLEDIFLDFVTTKPSTIGTGMGLAISRKIIESHHGKIWAESEGQYQGAAFIIELPTTDKPLPPPKDNRRYF